MKVDRLLFLSRDRQLVTPELHQSNDFYGHASLLKRYADLPPERSLKVAIEHGIALHDTIWANDLDTEMPLFLCAASERAHLYERQVAGRRRALAVGPMIHYASALTPDASPGRRRNLVAFPTHSSHRVRVRYDQEAFLRRLDELRPDFDEVLVCIYWRDVLDDAFRAYEERGYTCVTAGHMFDARFLPRLVRLLRSAALVYTNEVGSQVLYATLLDRPVLIERGKISYEAADEVLREDVPDFLEHRYVTTLLELFASRREDVSADQRGYVAEIAGAADTKSPAEMRALLLEADARYEDQTPLWRKAKHHLRRADYLRRRTTALFTR